MSKASMQKMLAKESQLSLTQWFALSIQAANIEIPTKFVEDELKAIARTLLVKITEVLNKYAEIFQE